MLITSPQSLPPFPVRLASSALWGLQTARRRRAPIPSSIEACQTQMNFQLSIPDPSATNWRLSNQPNFHLDFLCGRDSLIEGGLSEKLGSRSAIYETLVENVPIETSWDKGRNKETQSESIETLRSEERQKSSNWDTGAAPFPGPLTTSSPYKALSHPSLSFLMSLPPVASPDCLLNELCPSVSL